MTTSGTSSAGRADSVTRIRSLQRQHRLDRKFAAAGFVQNPDEERGGLKQAGENAGEEQSRHRLLGDNSVQDQRQARRNDDADRSRRPDDSQGERPWIASLEHRRDQDRPHRQRGRDARTADRRKQRAGDDGDESKRSRKSAEPGRGQIDQRVGDAAEPHECRRHHEQRQRHQGRRVELIDDELGGADQRLTGCSRTSRRHRVPAPERPACRQQAVRQTARENSSCRRLNRCRAARERPDGAASMALPIRCGDKPNQPDDIADQTSGGRRSAAPHNRSTSETAGPRHCARRSARRFRRPAGRTRSARRKKRWPRRN